MRVWLTWLCVAWVLSGCGGKPTQAPKTTTSPAISKSGGFYQNDGPGSRAASEFVDAPDATARVEPLHRFANRPYVVFGRTYTPMTELRPFEEAGLGSWYGRQFHGQKTSIGETYDMYAMTAAHPTLPLPSYARVTRTDTGKSVVVRVNDRGPFHAGRVIDLSFAAAAKLGYANAGSAPVRVELIALPNAAVSPPPGVATPTPFNPLPVTEDSPGTYFVQLGAFSNQANAERFLNQISEAVSQSVNRVPLLHVRGGFYRVRLGPYASAAAAQTDLARAVDRLGVAATVTR